MAAFLLGAAVAAGLDSREDGGFGGWVGDGAGGDGWNALRGLVRGCFIGCGCACCGCLSLFGLLPVEFFDESGGEGALFCGIGHFGGGGEGAEFGVGSDFFDELLIAGGFGGARDVEAGDLESVQEQSGAAGVDLVAGDAAKHFADGDLDGGAVFGER